MSYTDKPIRCRRGFGGAPLPYYGDGPVTKDELYVTEIGIGGHHYRQEWPSLEAAERAIEILSELEQDGQDNEHGERVVDRIIALVGEGHTFHCAKRMGWGDGECDCGRAT